MNGIVIEPPNLMTKRDHLIEILQSMNRVAVALSGGVDSSLVAKAAYIACGKDAIAITSDSPSVARSELDLARKIAAEIGIEHRILETQEFSNPDYQRNDGSRCYHCKSELYDQMILSLAMLEGYTICSGANMVDLGDYRPGLQAAKERHIRHPLQEANFSKSEVRQLAQEWGLPNWNKPAAPCLSSRVAPGVAVTPERIVRIEAAEKWLYEQGIQNCRVRLHENELARIEVAPSEIPILLKEPLRSELSKYFHSLGFAWSTIDLDGFRSGNLNELVNLQIRQKYSS